MVLEAAGAGAVSNLAGAALLHESSNRMERQVNDRNFMLQTIFVSRVKRKGKPIHGWPDN